MRAGRLSPGTTIDVSVSRPGYNGETHRYKVMKTTMDESWTRCLPEGKSTPGEGSVLLNADRRAGRRGRGVVAGAFALGRGTRADAVEPPAPRRRGDARCRWRRRRRSRRRASRRRGRFPRCARRRAKPKKRAGVAPPRTTSTTSAPPAATVGTRDLRPFDVEPSTPRAARSPRRSRRARSKRSAEPVLAPGDNVAGYRIDGVLGRGGMGVVYTATQLSLNRTVALKFLADVLGDGPRLPRALPPRGPDPGRAGPPAHRAGLRGGRGRRRPVPRDAARARAEPQGADPRRPARRGAHAARAEPDRRRAGHRPRGRPDPPRHQAAEHPRRARATTPTSRTSGSPRRRARPA